MRACHEVRGEKRGASRLGSEFRGDSRLRQAGKQRCAVINLIQVSQLAQAINSIAVVASLVFVGLQLHRNTLTTHAASHHAIIEALNRINLLWAQDKDLVRIFLAGVEDRRALTQEERWRFDSVLRAYLHVYETMYTEAALGAVDDGIVMAEDAGIKFVFGSAEVRDWWTENPFRLSGEFRNHIERLVGR